MAGDKQARGHVRLTRAAATELQDYTRHHVKNADYPAVVSADKGRKIVGRQLTDDEASVRGTVVRGLSRSDIQFLDTFEGDVRVSQYNTETRQSHTLTWHG